MTDHPTDDPTDSPADEPTGESDATGTVTGDRLEWDVPAGAPTHVCGRCGRPFAEPSSLDLHRGLDHWDDLEDGERDAYWAARGTETDDLRRFRIVALGALVLLYFGFLILYAVVT